MTEKLQKLAARVEALEGPDREVDAEIAAAMGVKHGPDGGWCNSENGDYWTADECAPAYTASLDAAMTLRPGRWQLESLSAWDAPPDSAYKNERQHSWSRATLCGTSVSRGLWGHSGGDGRVTAEAATPALALCAAALRAHAQDGEG